MESIDSFVPRISDPDRQKDRISVIVAVYNIEPWLKRCVRSICAQTYRNLQILLVDDGSTDGCLQLCDRLAQEDDRIEVIHKPNGGLSDARNAGIRAASGSLITFVDGDDWIEPQMYETLLSAMKQYEAPLAVCRYKQVYRNRTEDLSTGKLLVFEGMEALECFLLEEDAVAIQNAAWNKLYTRELMGELVFPDGKYYEDIVYTTRLLARAPRTVYVDRGLYDYVVEREGSIMGEGIGERIFSDQIPAYQEKDRFLRGLGRDDLADIHRYFYYKRLLLYYRTLSRTERVRRRDYRTRIRKLLKADAGEMDRVYACKGANSNEKKKMELFLGSPAVYLAVMYLNELVILPIKMYRLRRLKG